MLLGTKSLAPLASASGFSLAVLLAVGAALTFRWGLPSLLGTDREQGELAMSRVAFTLLILGWGPLAAFQIANFPSIDSLVVSGSLGPVWSYLIPSGGLPLLKLAQAGALLLAALLAATTFWGVRQRFLKDRVEIPMTAWMTLFGLFCVYLILNLALILGA
jgi:hypothetical protein